MSLALSPVCIGLVLGPVAWITGNKALADIDGSPHECTNRRHVVAGRRYGIIATVLLAVILVALVVWTSTFTLCSSGSESC